MAQQNEVGGKFTIDISDLKAGISEANRLMRLADSEFKAAAAGMGDWSKSADGLTAKATQLNKAIDIQQAKIDALEEEYQRVVEAQGENSAAAQNLRIKINNETAAREKNKKSLSDVTAALDEMEKEAEQAANAADGLADSERDVEKSTKDAGKAADSASGGFTVMKGALAELVADGIEKAVEALKDFAMESSEALAKLQAAVGLTNDEFVEYKNQLEEIYAQNYGESIADLGEKFAYIKQVTGETDPTKIGELLKNTIALEDTFGSDFKETLRGVQNLMTHFGLSAEEAFDLFAKGSQVGLDYTDELGDNVAEYAGNFAQAGYSAEEYFQLLENGANGGAYNLDKVNDSINEIKNRLGDGTIKDSISSFSDTTQDLFKKWESGEGTMKDVINSIVSDISECTNEQEALNLAAVAFGTMGEDANLDVVKSLTTVGDTFEDVTGTMKEVDEIRYDNLSSAISGLGRTLQTTLLTPVIDKLSPALTDMIEGLVSGLTGGSSLGELMTVGSEWLRNIGEGLVSSIPALISSGLDTLLNFTSTLKQNAPQLIASGMELLKNMVQGLMNSLPDLISKVPTIVSNLARTISASMPTILAKGVEIIWTIIKGLIQAIPTLIANIPKIIMAIVDVMMAYGWGSLGKNIIKSLGSGIKSMAGSIGTAAKNIFNAIVNVIKGLPQKLWDMGKSALSYMKNALTSTGSISGAASKIVSAIVNVIKTLPSKMKSIGKNLVEGLWNGIKDMKSWVISKIKGFGDSVLTGLKNFFGIKSPSTVMRDQVGKMLAEGIGVGFTDNIGGVIKDVNAALNPTLNIAGQAGGAAAAGTVINFTQNNNSPKALSPYEVYRQTKIANKLVTVR